MSRIINTKRKWDGIACIKCSEPDCAKQRTNKTYDYCCLCLPLKYRTKTLEEYVCDNCKQQMEVDHNE